MHLLARDGVAASDGLMVLHYRLPPDHARETVVQSAYGRYIRRLALQILAAVQRAPVRHTKAH